MTERIPLTKSQREIMTEFYRITHQQVVLRKCERNKIWDEFKNERVIPQIGLEDSCPALLNELERAMCSGDRVQSAVFSECVYAQTLANMFDLNMFTVYKNDPSCLNSEEIRLIGSYGLTPRYVYRTLDGRQTLIQAGGNAGVDSALFSVVKKDDFSNEYAVHTIEFKEAAAKTSEPDLPKYGEDGLLPLMEMFIMENPQFKLMIKEQIENKLNFFKVIGSNVHNFSPASINAAVTENYAGKKYADVICTEDTNGYLTMMPANQVGLWAETRGEIRPAGRNKYKVWTMSALQVFIRRAGGTTSGNTVSMPLGGLTTSAARGGYGIVNRYKINSLFFVYAKDLTIYGETASFDIRDVWQLKPTISAHMFFNDLNVTSVSKYYFEES